MRFEITLSIAFLCLFYFTDFVLTGTRYNRYGIRRFRPWWKKQHKDCPSLSLRHGEVKEYWRGRLVVFRCNLGYSLVDGDKYRRCTSCGVWTGRLPRCEAITCQKQGIANGIFKTSDTDLRYGTDIFYSCDNCYELVSGDTRRTCGLDGKLSGTLPVCKGVTCGIPDKLFNGNIIGNDFTCGAKVLYECNEDYELKGPSSRLCGENGKWIGTRPICKSRIEEGALRLVNGADGYYGRVEIHHNGIWGTICIDDFNDKVADVICRQLNLRTDNDSLSYYVDGYGKGMMWLNEIVCNGTEERLTECQNSGWVVRTCSQEYSVGVVCINDSIVDEKNSDGDVRLVDGSSPYNGRVEVYYNGVWGTVYETGADNELAEVVCRQLNLGINKGYKVLYYLDGRGKGMIWLGDSNLKCTGKESNLSECINNRWGYKSEERDDHEYDIGIICNGSIDYHPEQQGALRIAGNGNYGRLEFLYDDVWGTICRGKFGNEDAVVACRQLKLDVYNTSISKAYYETDVGGKGPVWLDIVQCTSSETKLINCPSRGKGIHETCEHDDDIGVICKNNSKVEDLDQDGAIRLTGGSNTYGRLEIYHNGIWGTVCNLKFDEKDAEVACRQLGFGINTTSAKTYYVDGLGEGVVWLRDLECVGSENNLMECSYDGWGITSGCNGHRKDVGIICINESDPNHFAQQGALRLVGGGDTYGLLEINFDGAWGTICKTGFDNADAEVACRQLGLGINTTDTNGFYRDRDSGKGMIWLTDLACTGTENRLDECQRGNSSINFCTHGTDIGIICSDH